MSIKQSPTVLEKLAVDNGSSLTFSSDSRGLVIEDFNLGTDSKLNLACGMGGLEIVNGAIDSSAKISIQVNDNLAKPVYPLISFSDEATANTVVSQISFIGEGVDNYNLNRFRNCLYLSNGVEPTHEVTLSSTNIWTGEANASWSDERNWLSGYKPIATTNKGHAEIFIAGTRNTDMVNEIEGLYVKRLHFLDSCGPVRISGGKIFFTLNGYRNVKSSPIYSLSYFPVMIDADLETVNALSTVAAKDSYVSLNGKVVIKGLFRPSGEIRVGGQLECGTGILLETKCADGRSTRMRVLNGGSVTATLQMTNQTTASSCYVIDAGGTLVLKDGKNNKGVRSVCGHLVSLKPSLVNGEMDIQCPYFTTKDQYYNGTGEIKFASVQSHELGSSSVIVGGGLTVKPASWTTVSAEAPGNYIKIAVTNNAILSASANWTYGPAEGVTPTTSAEERALTLAPNSTLTIRTDGFRVAFADPIIGAGDVVVESGSRLALAGELFNEAASQSWTTFAKVKSFTYDEGAFPSTVRLRTVDNGDGTVDVQARIVPGLTISIR